MTHGMRAVLLALLVLLLLPPGGSGMAAAAGAGLPGPLDALTFLLGTWEGSGSGQPGASAGTATFARGLQDRVIIRTSYAEYPATKTAAAFRHDDLMIIHAADRAGIRADYYDNEGHVIRYTVTVAAPGEVTFVGDTVAGEPRFRLTYRLAPDGVLHGSFDMAPPGKPEVFSRYLTFDMKKVK